MQQLEHQLHPGLFVPTYFSPDPFWVCDVPNTPYNCSLRFPGDWKVRSHASCSVVHMLLTKSRKKKTHGSLLFFKEEPAEPVWAKLEPFPSRHVQWCRLYTGQPFKGVTHTDVITHLCVYCKYFLTHDNKTSWKKELFLEVLKSLFWHTGAIHGT